MSNLIYNPGQKRKSDLISEFVIRQDIYEDIMRDLENSSMKHPEQHYLLVGQRGMGKTTLLLRLQYGIEDSVILGGQLLPIAFTEEQYQISELVGLWEYVAEYLEDRYHFDSLYEEIAALLPAPDEEEKAYELINAALENAGKHLVLLVDNIGDLFHKLGKNEMRRLREILQINNRIRVIGGSTNYMEAVLDYHQPFYEFFKIIRLDGLSADETVRLTLRLGKLHGETEKIERIVREMPGRIETLRILTGGVPRTIVIMFGIFLDHEHEHALKDLHKILDVVTPLYKHRMDDLPVQQQKIVDAVARHWEPITVKELTEKTRLVSKTLSAQLNQLEKEQIVVKQDTSTRNKTYMIRERFWNIWYLMRYGRRDDKEKIVWLVKFLESWLSDDELKQRIELFVNKVKLAEISEDHLRFFGKVYAAMTNLTTASKLQLKSIEKEMKKEIVLSDQEWLECAQGEYEKKNYFNSYRNLMKVKDWGKPEMFAFLGEFASPAASKALIERLQDLLSDIDHDKLAWGLMTINLLGMVSLTKRSKRIDHDNLVTFLKDQLRGHIINGKFFEVEGVQLLFTIRLTAEFIRQLISIGLYNAVFKVLDEASVQRNNKILFIKDQWRPLYLAVKYLYQPEELQKQPSEMGATAIDLAAIISRKDEV